MQVHSSTIILKITQYKICSACGKLGHWWTFKRPPPGGGLPMVTYDDCNSCARIKRWYESLSKEEKELLALYEAEDTGSTEYLLCSHCEKRGFGSKRPVFNDRWICDICYWRHASGRCFIE